ncbi:two-component system response regulator [Leptothoe kymatousa]|uniref:EAL domain-containing protein n=1 Tax=Leptothoe kymatousa TAU-MAC 1615 TaxID=2364775 RepID=A0ABS5Y6C5_9CYAN|nr:GGDEF domain-containing phosphodiesterase [Leptothoe kymatousa]MBT9313186.1 EAL domain-containing protein [Leptothoe kymatousa TAU-MAC 1615]
MQKILLIGSSKLWSTTTLKVLATAGYSVEQAGTGAAGLELAQSHAPNLVLCEWQLSDCEGDYVLQKMRNDGQLAITPLIMLSSLPDPGHVRHMMQLGADDCLVYPFADDTLLSAIATRLQHHDAVAHHYLSHLRRAAEHLNRLSNYDSLTKLPNHLLFEQRFDQLIQASKEPVALLSLSLDRLRQINNILGYPAGDSILQSASHRLQACLPDSTPLARLTGNQFAIALRAEDPQLSNISQLTTELMDALSRPFSLPDHEVFLSASIGVSIYPKDSQEFPTLMRQADAALEYAKSQKSSYCQFYQSDMVVATADQIRLETWLRYALERNEFEVYYQPQLNLRTGRIEAAEALIRWKHPEMGYISPGQFIPLAEETGLIISIGQWVLETACKQARQWHDMNLGLRHMSVNLSSVQFNQGTLSQQIAHTIKNTGLSPHMIELEITETALMQDANAAIRTLNELKDLGMRLAVDDFGTGYSSLGYLQKLPIDTLKIDNCFVRGVTTDHKNQVILQSAIQMGHDLGLCIVAEGVETMDEQSFLEAYQCDFVQGYLIGKPMNAAQLQAYLEQRLALVQIAV